ncbi:MAG: hypothetical protein WC462_00090 [archaeon]
MSRFVITLPEDLYSALQVASSNRRCSMASVIRACLYRELVDYLKEVDKNGSFFKAQN